jgi:phosphate transport system protein
MTILALDMLRDVLDSFIESDEEMAYTLPLRDKAVDELNRTNRKTIMAQIEQNPSFSYQGIELIFISKSIERVADHAANISEEVVYLVSGEDTRHPAARTSGF